MDGKVVLQENHRSLRIICVLVAIAWTIWAPFLSSAKCNQLRVGLVDVGSIAVRWRETTDYSEKIERAHVFRQKINKLAPFHSSACLFEAPFGTYEHICGECRNKAKELVEELGFLAGQEALCLRLAETIRIGAVTDAAERVRKRQNLDVLIDRERGIVAGLGNIIEGRDQGALKYKCIDLTEMVTAELTRMQVK